MSFNKKVLLVGPFPEPVGGVSIHLIRLKDFLQNYFQIDCIDESPIAKSDFFNIRSFNFIKYACLLYKADLVHVHSTPSILRFFHCLFASVFMKKVVVTLHSYRDQNYLNRMLDFFSLKLADKIIAVSEKVAIDCGFNCEVIPAFIYPTQDELSLDAEWYELFTGIRAAGKKILVSNAYRLDDFHGRDLYGFDQILELFTDPKIQKDWVAVLNVSTITSCEDKFSEFKRFVENKIPSHAVYLFNKKVSFSAVLSQADASVRATLSDGDALSVRESLLLGVKTIASDCVVRPSGTVLYKASDVASLRECLLMNGNQELTENRSFENDILMLYKELF
jgi:hypothetical protein